MEEFSVSGFDWVMMFFNEYVISYMPPMILTLMVLRKVSNWRTDLTIIFQVLRWLIVLVSTLTLIYSIQWFVRRAGLVSSSDHTVYPLNAWILMLIGSSLLPLSLIFDKLGRKRWYIFLMSIGLALGAYFERYVIIMTTIMRDIDDGLFVNVSLLSRPLSKFILGVVYAIVALFFVRFITNRKNKK